ncbi:hypothetical protein R69927_06453 [Paraburkholderia domus]|uniref:Uncharacterized protein n=1 Tax=Paraburkholderia domus TaxID=2793075 RepID=A0A9N8N9V7_9BURK|nr:hypothetical protein R69749_00539 [Paraburkholderia domus]CAE6808668.1 hypothetical protein R75483_05693 [Paraburkholderia domus]CAE6848085.1 hypothetical protein R70006_07423 [Paraburkholderia domus]CAE6918946.1 hypothetical protein R69927_06453 [Paraburkholderia domus]CAE6957102.1 hypothetical protein R70199_07034 [Paraburkholderia domus]
MRHVQSRARAAQRTFSTLGVLSAPSVLNVLKRDRRSADKTDCMRHQPDNMPVAIMDKGRRLSPGITKHHLKYNAPACGSI